jgi:hypothetical protein
MPALANLAGKRFGRLVVGSVSHRETPHVFWHCVCDCGTKLTVRSQHLRMGKTRSCGCLRLECKVNFKHGKTRTDEHSIWLGILARCSNPNVISYHNYGGRGISVCDRWKTFLNFLDDMGPRPSKKHSIDRINPDGNYEPSNCRWATQIEQFRNKRTTRRVRLGGKDIPLVEAWEAFGKVVHYETAITRIRKGWSVKDAFTIIPAPRKRRSSKNKLAEAA